ncbi:MAG: restriction endonuclease subunit S [Enhygromyxa sp.]
MSSLPNDWRQVRVANIAASDKNAMATGPFGSAISSRHFVADGVPVIRGSNLSELVGQRLSHDNLVFISKEKAEQFRRSAAVHGDLVFTCWGTIGQVGLIDERAAYERYIVSNKQMKLTPDRERADSLFLYYAFSTPAIMQSIQGQAIGSSVPGFNLGQLKAVEIPLPPVEEQRRIAAVLGALDDKIELNRKMNRTLEEMAQALFKSWFMDFDGHNDLVDSELGPIPRGWMASSLGKEFHLTMGLSPPGSSYNEIGEGLPFFQGARDFGPRFPSRRVYTTDARRVARKGDTLISVRAPVGTVNMALEDCCIGRGVAALRHRSGSRSYTFAIAQNLKSRFETYNAEGTVFGSINKKDFLRMAIIEPPPATIAMFDSVVGPVDDRVEANNRESRTLAELRDLLLPKLISGELRVPEAAELIESAP